MSECFICKSHIFLLWKNQPNSVISNKNIHSTIQREKFILNEKTFEFVRLDGHYFPSEKFHFKKFKEYR